MTLAALAGAVRGGELSPREAVQDALDRIERLDPALNSFITVRAEEALAEAKAFGLSTSGPLRGVPVAVKDVIDVAGTPTTAASKVLEDNVPTRDAAVVERLRRAGAIVVGKLNTHEFAFGASTTSAAFGPAHNPWDNERICGGSSGGSGRLSPRASSPARSERTPRGRSASPRHCAASRGSGPPRAASRTAV